MCKSAILYSKRDYSLGEALRFICREQKVNLVYSLTFPELLHKFISTNPEVIFFDAESINFPYEIYKDFKSTRIFDVPKIVILSPDPESLNFCDEDIVIVDKKNYSQVVNSFLKEVQERSAKNLSPERVEELRGKIARLLTDLGVTTKYLGYEYIRELVIDIIRDKRMLKSFNAKLYPKLAIKYSTQVNNIERNIRNAINIATSRCKNRMLFDEICGRSCLHNASLIPSNKQFITWIVDKVS